MSRRMARSDARRCSDAVCNFCARWLRPGRKLCLCPTKRQPPGDHSRDCNASSCLSDRFTAVLDQGRPVGYTIELCERIARSLEAQLNVALTIKWVAVDERN